MLLIRTDDTDSRRHPDRLSCHVGTANSPHFLRQEAGRANVQWCGHRRQAIAPYQSPPSKTSYSAERSDSYVFAAVEARVLNKSLD
jgi:hypothetical protein